MNFYITSMMFLVFDQINKILCQSVPISPCPKVFQYRFDGSEWFGVMSLRNPELGEPVHLKVALSLRGKPTTNYLGEIELLSRGQFLEDTPIMYKIKFPKNQIPPKLVQIVVNNRIICLGAIDQSIFVTQIQLEHTRKFTFLPHDLPPSPSSSSGGGLSDVLDTNHHPLSIDDFGSKQMPIFTKEKNPLHITSELCGRVDDRISSKQDSALDALRPHPLPDDGSISRGDWPWLAAIYVNNLTSLSYQCGGTLISSRIVISSAHCFHMYKKLFTSNEVLVFLGRYNLKNWNEEGSIAAPVDDIFIHPDYDSNLNSYDADIAVIVLKNEVRFNKFIRPACLWTSSSSLEYVEGEHGVLVGWGHSHHSAAVMTTPTHMKATVVSNQVCFKSNDQFRSLSSNRTFCAGDRTGNGPCKGDSGTGLMLQRNNRWMLRGIVSAALPTSNRKSSCSSKEFVVYTDVAKFLDWIYAFII